MLGNPSTGEAAEKVSFLPWTGEPPRDECYWMCRINRATIVMNREEGLLTDDEARAFGRAMREVEKECDAPGNPRPKMYIRFEPLVRGKAGVESTIIHAGRSSHDIHSTFQRAIMRERLLDLMDAALAAREALLARAENWKDVILPNYTNGVAAQPNTLGHEWVGHVQGMERDFRDMKFVWDELNRSPLGSTVLNGTSWPLNRQRTAELLGFESVLENAYDAVQIATQDAFLSVHRMMEAPMLHIGHFVQNVMTQYAQPHPWMLVASTYASSAMPQKRNPGPLIDLRRDATQVLSESLSQLLRMHNLMPGMYDAKDLPIVEELMKDATTVFNNFADVLGLLRVDPERALAEVNADWTTSQELADRLMRDCGVPFRVGHRFGSQLVGRARSENWTPLTAPFSAAQDVWAEVAKAVLATEPESDLPAELPMTEAEFRAALDPVSLIENRRTWGSPQPEDMARQFIGRHASLAADRAFVQERREALARAAKALDNAFDVICTD